MVNFQNKKIFYTLKEYQNNYNILLKEYLNQHEDFDELMFLEIEVKFYNLCFDSSNIVFEDIGYGPQYGISGGYRDEIISEINNSLSTFLFEINDGYDLELSAKYKASFSKILKFLKDKMDKVKTLNSTAPLTYVAKDTFTSETYCENLINDPLYNPGNEYQILKSKFKKEYHSKTAHLKTEVDFLLYNLDTDFDEWEKEQKEEINNTFLKLVKELNNQNIFFFGCSFDNYRHNYDKRLNGFLNLYTDASNIDFIEDELKFLEDILYDIQNSESAHDGHSQSGYNIFSKAYEFVSIVGYKQYYFSHNKKVDFLKNTLEFALQMKEFSKPKIFTNPKIIVEKEKPNTFELNENLKKETRFFNISETEENKLDDINNDLDDNQNISLMPTIEDYLEEFKPDINGDGYEILINALYDYFSKGKFPVLISKINFKRINKKRVGWALKELYKSEKTDNLEIEYFRFAQENINLFAKEVIAEEGFLQSKFYKSFTTNPTK